MVARTTSPQFIPVQRWLSETEMEQGLGIVTELQGRMVTLLFPVTGEFRRYANHDAPLARFRLFPDEQSQHGDGWSFRVTRVSEQNGLFVYHGIHSETEDRKSTRLNSSHVRISYAVFCLKKKNTRKR